MATRPTPAVAHRQLSTSTSSKTDWLENLILVAKTILAAAESLPFPCADAAFRPVVPILEAVQVRDRHREGKHNEMDFQRMNKNREDYKDLCGSIIDIMAMLQDEITRHGVSAATKLEELCGKLARSVLPWIWCFFSLLFQVCYSKFSGELDKCRSSRKASMAVSQNSKAVLRKWASL
jgi:hypothetical protein